jgi:meiotic recombination protein SPO11
VKKGRGYPDVSTRAFLKWLTERLAVPSFALVDADPHGMEVWLLLDWGNRHALPTICRAQIMSVYCVGSRAMAHDAKNLSVPTLRWLGVLPSDLARYNLPKSARIPLGPRDTQKITSLLQREYIRGNAAWRRELELMAKLGYKAEVESLQSGHQGLRFLSEHFLPDKLAKGLWV